MPLLGCKEMKEGYDTGFKKSFREKFVPSCEESAVKSGGSDAVVKPLCECTAKELVDHHTTGELTTMSASPTSPSSKKMVETAVAACKGKAH